MSRDGARWGSVAQGARALLGDSARGQDDLPVVWRDLAWRDADGSGAPGGRRPVVVLESLEEGRPTGRTGEVPLRPGMLLGTAPVTEEDTGSGLWCSGYARGVVEEDGPRFVHEPCDGPRRIRTGQQCPQCEARDEFRGLHRIHRGAEVMEAARAYATRPHWLYVATFPDGTSKVGTAHERSKTRRLDQQAVAAASYVALAEDGIEVRNLEDAVGQELGLTQFKRASTKYRAWLAPLPGADLAQLHADVAREAREYLSSLDDPLSLHEPRHRVVEERWAPDLPMHRAYEALRARDPLPLLGEEGWGARRDSLWIGGAVGPFLTAHRGDPDRALLLNAAALKNRAVALHEDDAVPVAAQDALF